MRNTPMWRRYLRMLGSDPAADVEDELRFHLETRVEDLVRGGLIEAEARARAEREFGDTERIRREMNQIDRDRVKREGRARRWESLAQDLRYGVRHLVRSPGFAAVAILTLALGIGANTAIFSVVNAVLLRPLPYAQPERLVTIYHHYPSYGNLEASVAVPTYRDLQDRTQLFESVSVQSWWGVNFTGEERPERLSGSQVTGEFFRTLGAEAALGRTLSPEDMEAGRERLVVLSHGLWERLFGGSRDVVGRTMQLDGEGYEVIGVMPASFRDFFNSGAELWAPVTFDPGLTEARTMEFLMMTARLAPGLTPEQGARRLAEFSTRLKEIYPEAYPADWSLGLRSLDEQGRGDIRPVLLLLLGAVGFVLLIAVANVANLLLARGTRRRSEMAVRAALGAGRGRVARQLITESLVLGLLGGAAGVLLAYWGTAALFGIAPAELRATGSIPIDASVLGFALGASVLAGLLFGLVPALHAAGYGVQVVLRQESRGAGGAGGAFGQGGIRRLVVGAEIALAVVLMIGAGLMMRSLENLQQADPGFEAENVLSLMTTLSPSEYGEPERQAAFFRSALEEVRALAGVEAAGGVSTLPATGSGWTTAFTVEGFEPPPSAPGPWGEFRVVTPGYFETLRVPLLRGRVFGPEDDAGSPRVAVVDTELAERYWPGENPIGRRVQTQGEWREVVGVVGHVSSAAVEASPRTQVYVPHQQLPVPHVSLVVRSATDPSRMASPVAEAVRRVDSDQPVYEVRAMEEVVASSARQRRFVTTLLALFAVLALVLAAIGIYGVMSYAVAQRTREMGIRMAVGAQARTVVGMVLRQGLTTAVVGATVGVLGAIAVVRLLRSQLYAVSPSDPLTYVGAFLVFVLVAFVATYVPARRAARFDPVSTLHVE